MSLDSSWSRCPGCTDAPTARRDGSPRPQSIGPGQSQNFSPSNLLFHSLSFSSRSRPTAALLCGGFCLVLLVAAFFSAPALLWIRKSETEMLAALSNRKWIYFFSSLALMAAWLSVHDDETLSLVGGCKHGGGEKLLGHNGANQHLAGWTGWTAPAGV